MSQQYEVLIKLCKMVQHQDKLILDIGATQIQMYIHIHMQCATISTSEQRK